MTTLERHKELLKYSIDLIDTVFSKGVISNLKAIAFAAS